MRLFTLVFFTACITLGFADSLPSIAEKTKDLIARDGLLTTYIDDEAGSVFVKLPPPDSRGRVGEYLYNEALGSGLGSNDIGLDRNSFGPTYVLDIKVIGKRVVFEAQNYSFRTHASDGNPTQTIPSEFGTSIIWAGELAARDKDGSSLIDLTSFTVRDAHGVDGALKGYSVDPKRSYLDASTTRGFPQNLEFGAVLTFASSTPGRLVGRHAPDPKSITLLERQSLVKLPDAGYHPRKFDPRAGGFTTDYMDFEAPLGQPLLKKLICRFRLEKTDPTAARSPVKKPIVFYVDQTTPWPVKSALIKGGNYWSKAFEAAGFTNAFRVEEMPANMDPLDIRYNVVLWLNRSTRGWAYGQIVTDPRTGEIIRGAVNLDAQRVRQDITIYEALLGTSKVGTGAADDPVRIALSRVQQLGAHEIGHSLGFRHNFAASTYGRASVMDYPAPKISVGKDGKLILDDAYAPGIGAWDVQAVRYAYTEFGPSQNEAAELDKIINKGISSGLLYLSDEDADEPTGADARASRFDNGADSVANLRLSLQIRQIAMQKFGERNIHTGQPVALIEEVFGPLYFFHRYDVDAVVKLVGGLHYVHAVKGDGQTLQAPVPASEQNRALDSLFYCLDPAVLNVPNQIAKLMGPRPLGYDASGEEFSKNATFVFDTLAAATSGADLVIGRLTEPSRCARIVELSARDASLPTLRGIFDRLVKRATSIRPDHSGMSRAIDQAVAQLIATRLMDLAESSTASPRVATEARIALRSMLGQLTVGAHPQADPALNKELANLIGRFLNRPLISSPREPSPLPALPGAPIGN